MTTFDPDHNGECQHCDEPGDAHLCPGEAHAKLEQWASDEADALREVTALTDRVTELEQQLAIAQKNYRDCLKLYEGLHYCDRCEKSPLDGADEPVVLCASCAAKVHD